MTTDQATFTTRESFAAILSAAALGDEATLAQLTREVGADPDAATVIIRGLAAPAAIAIQMAARLSHTEVAAYLQRMWLTDPWLNADRRDI